MYVNITAISTHCVFHVDTNAIVRLWPCDWVKYRLPTEPFRSLKASAAQTSSDGAGSRYRVPVQGPGTGSRYRVPVIDWAWGLGGRTKQCRILTVSLWSRMFVKVSDIKAGSAAACFLVDKGWEMKRGGRKRQTNCHSKCVHAQIGQQKKSDIHRGTSFQNKQ